MTQKDKAFYKTVFMITLPISLQNMISYGVNLMDTIMLGKLGEVALSSASLANQMFFIFTIACYGIAGGAVVLSSQYWGKKDILAIQKVTTIALKITFSFAVFFTLIVLCFPSQIMSLFIRETEVIVTGSQYLRVVAISYLFFSVTSTFLVILRSTETVNISVIIYGISFIVNVFFNYIFIFGKFGCPAFGVVGAAMGTVIARITEFILTIIFVFFRETKIKYRLKMLLLKDKSLFHDLIQYGLPVMINELFWGVGTSLHSVILGHMGSNVVAANSICNVVFQMATSVIMGISNASAVIVGNVIGAKDYEYVKSCVKKLMRIFIILGLVSSVLLILIRNPIISIYDISLETKYLTEQLMVAYAAVIFFLALSCPLIMGIFRGSGSTKFAMVLDIGCLWFALPLGALGAFVFHLSPIFVFILLRIEMPIKMIIGLWYLKGNHWIKNVTRQ